MIHDLVTKYFRSLGFVKVKGSTSDITPLMPFLCLDIQYSYYQKVIAPIDATENLKDVRNKWRDAYNKLNKKFFYPYNQRDKDEIIDLMDSLEDAIKNDLLVLKVQIMNLIIDEPLDVQEVYSTCAVCNVLTRCALFYYETVYHDRWGKPIRNNAIKAIQDNSILFGYMYRNKPNDIEAASKKAVDDAITVVCRRIVHWMTQIRNKEQENELQGTEKRGSRPADLLQKATA